MISIENLSGAIMYSMPHGVKYQGNPLFVSNGQCTGLSAVAFLDANGNGILDAGEYLFPNGNFVFQVNNDGNFSYANGNGYYVFNDQNTANVYDVAFEIDPQLAPYFSMSPASYDDIPVPGTTQETLPFAIVQTQPFENTAADVAVYLRGYLDSFSNNYYNQIIISNLGFGPVSGTITYHAPPGAVLTYPIGATPTSDGFTETFSGLTGINNYTYHIFDYQTYGALMTLPGPPVFNPGDFAVSGVEIAVDNNADTNLANNTATLSKDFSAPYDPNEKTEAHGGQINIDDFGENDVLTYTIHFQNTGTAPAINVRLEDQLDAKLDETSIRTVAASSPVTMVRTGPHITWNLDQAMLPTQAEDDAASQGFVTFTVKPKPGFAAGDIIPNTADIYFDANDAVTTAVCNTEFTTVLRNPAYATSGFSLSPNLARDHVEHFVGRFRRWHQIGRGL